MSRTKHTTDHRIFANTDSHHRDKQTTYINVRVTSLRNRNDTKDIAIWLENGQRLKVPPQSFEGGQVRRGYFRDDQRLLFNNRIDDIVNKVHSFVRSHPEATKKQIEIQVYGTAFLASHKKRRTFSVDVPEIVIKPSEILREFYKEFPKRVITRTETNKSVDDDGFEVVSTRDIDETVDPISLQSFPNNLPLKVFEWLKSEFNKEHRLPKDFDQSLYLVLLENYAQKKFYVADVTEVHTIQKEVHQKIDPRQFVDEDGDFLEDYYNQELIDRNNKAIHAKQKELIESLSPEDRYAKGFRYVDGAHKIDPTYFNPNSIIQVLGLARFGVKYNESQDKLEKISKYNRLWKSLLDYWVNADPNDEVKSFDTKWASNFLRYMASKGHIKQNNKFGSNIFKLNTVEYKSMNRKGYSVNTFYNLVKWTKDYVEQLYLLKLIPHDFSKGLVATNFHKFHASKEYEAKHYILPNEFLTIYNSASTVEKMTREKILMMLGMVEKNGNFLNVEGYTGLAPEIVKSQNKTNRKIIYDYGLSIKLLNNLPELKEILIRTARLFCCQTLLGGIRVSDFNDTNKTRVRQNHSYLFVKFNQRKTKGRIQNPILQPVVDICEMYGGEFPERFADGDYNKYLKLLFRVIGLDRPFIDEQPAMEGGYGSTEVPLHKAITNRFSRATFVALMTSHGVPDKEIMKWTGHKSYDTFTTHYQPILEDVRVRNGNAVVAKFFGTNSFVED